MSVGNGHALIELSCFAAALVVAVTAAADVGVGGLFQIGDHDGRGGGDAGAFHGQGGAGDGVGSVDILFIAALVGHVFEGAVGIVHAGHYRSDAGHDLSAAAQGVAGHGLPVAFLVLAFGGQHHHVGPVGDILHRVLQLAAVGQIEGDDLLRVQLGHDELAGGLVLGRQQLEQVVHGHAAVGRAAVGVGHPGQTQQLGPGQLIAEDRGHGGQRLAHADGVQLLDEGGIVHVVRILRAHGEHGQLQGFQRVGGGHLVRVVAGNGKGKGDQGPGVFLGVEIPRHLVGIAEQGRAEQVRELLAVIAAGEGKVRLGVVVPVAVKAGGRQQVVHGHAGGDGLLAEFAGVEGGIDLLRLGQRGQFRQGIGPLVGQGRGVCFVIHQTVAGHYQHRLILAFPGKGTAAAQQDGRDQQKRRQKPQFRFFGQCSPSFDVALTLIIDYYEYTKP